MISGTDQEPLYILDFNGYYRENDRSGTLTMEGVSYNTREAGEHTVVTDVSFPLTGGMSRYYYKNLYLYVPAMSNLNGEISGIVFENGHFNVDGIVTLYWDTLTKQEPQEDSRSMQISAQVQEESSSPDYEVSIPSSIALGSLSRTQDNVQPYEIRVSTENREGQIQVSAPAEGLLESGGNSLAFANDFGTQTFDASSENLVRSGENAVLKGNITIRAEDAAAAEPGKLYGDDYVYDQLQAEWRGGAGYPGGSRGSVGRSAPGYPEPGGRCVLPYGNHGQDRPPDLLHVQRRHQPYGKADGA